MKLVKFDFETKSTSKGLVIEGFANANTVDRGGERIEPKGWQLDNYKKNPVILFDHGKDVAFGSIPVGKATSVEAQDGGLFLRSMISQSKSDKISAVRDLVEEGILKTFSVGFNPIGESEKSNNGLVIKSAELIECSIVPVPMNQDSTFAVSQRSFKSAMANDWFSQYAKAHDLYKKGARFAAIITDHARKNGHDFPTLMEILKKAGIKEDRAISILDGNDLSLDKDTIQIFSNALSIDIASFDVINTKGGDMATETTTDTTTEETTEAEACDKPKMKELSPEEMTAAMDQMKAEAVACATDAEGNPAAWVADEEAWTKAKEAADKTYSRDDAEKYYAVVTWLYLNRFGGTKKSTEVSQDDASKAADALATKQAMASGDAAVPGDQNPHIELAKQSNVLLGVLIAEMQKVNLRLEKLVEVEPTGENQDTTTPPPANEEAKNIIAKIQKSHDDLRKRLERFSA